MLKNAARAWGYPETEAENSLIRWWLCYYQPAPQNWKKYPKKFMLPGQGC
ncbi:MAG: hypothetical protein WKF97_18835 [Chitinophagaceae bacterium]